MINTLIDLYTSHNFTPNSDPNESMKYFIEFYCNHNKNPDKIKEIEKVHYWFVNRVSRETKLKCKYCQQDFIGRFDNNLNLNFKEDNVGVICDTCYIRQIIKKFSKLETGKSISETDESKSKPDESKSKHDESKSKLDESKQSNENKPKPIDGNTESILQL